MEPFSEGHDKYYRTLDLVKIGMTVEGTASFSEETDVNCTVPSQTNPATGVIGEDFRSIKIKWRETTYDWHALHDPSTGETRCNGVNSMGETESDLDLTRLGP